MRAACTLAAANEYLASLVTLGGVGLAVAFVLGLQWAAWRLRRGRSVPGVFNSLLR